MNRDEILGLAREAGVMPLDHFYVTDVFLQRFVHLVEQRLIREGYRKCAEGQRTTQYCGLLDAAVKAEREACAAIAEKELGNTAMLTSMPPKSSAAWNILFAIRARGET
jgi:hypothetical protein